MLTTAEKSQLQAITSIVPVQPLFDSQQDAHDDFMRNCVQPALAEARELGCFPSEALFVESLKEVWMSVYSKYVPSEVKAAA